MNKNKLLYILLAFLIVVNGFFLSKYLGVPEVTQDRKKPMGDAKPFSFIAKELKFEEEQLVEFEKISKEHHQAMRRSLDATKALKDELFDEISKDSIFQDKVDSIIDLLGKQGQKKEKQIFFYLRDVRRICNDKQKERFANIISDALRKRGAKGERPEGPPHGRPEGPPGDMLDGPPPPRP
ncbi:hypothetical protein Q4Q35_07795 [Flavivirga aquimarina]|uniref:Periplasmic heavy metal sensor n=1 Tax=Flavivirga aquimarina TaxID=2027862 RepID=A0ABT8W997_9FLAO|nr:hypothetical protein [Flavivirga aquimarina]MDO5969707.1 hypothetical protein [Flavivirga aquimarina]